MHEKIEFEISVLQSKIERLKQWDEAMHIAAGIVGTLNPEWDPRVSVGIEAGVIEGVLIHLDPPRISDVAPILRSLAVLGWHQKPDSKPDFSEAIHSLSWHLTNLNNPAPIVVNAFFWDRTHQVCKLVKVGIKEVPVYEIKCEGEDVLKPKED